MTSSGVTVIDFNEMQSAIQAYRQKSQQIMQIIEAVEKILSALQMANVFSGGAASSVIAAFKQYKQVLQLAKANLDKLIDLLEGKLTNYQNAHTQANSIAGSIQQAQWNDV